MRRLHPGTKAKSNWIYDLDMIRRLYVVSRNTPLNWIRQGLRPIDDQKPIAIRGDELNRFHRRRCEEARCRLAPHELFCLGCKRPKQPLNGQIRFIPSQGGSGQITAVCPHCSSAMFRFVGVRTAAVFFARYEVKDREDKRHYGEDTPPPVVVHSAMQESRHVEPEE